MADSLDAEKIQKTFDKSSHYPLLSALYGRKGGGSFMPATFLALYRGTSVQDAEVVAVSVDPRLVGQVARALLDHESYPFNSVAPPQTPDPVVSAVRRG